MKKDMLNYSFKNLYNEVICTQDSKIHTPGKTDRASTEP